MTQAPVKTRSRIKRKNSKARTHAWEWLTHLPWKLVLAVLLIIAGAGALLASAVLVDCARQPERWLLVGLALAVAGGGGVLLLHEWRR